MCVWGGGRDGTTHDDQTLISRWKAAHESQEPTLAPLLLSAQDQANVKFMQILNRRRLVFSTARKATEVSQTLLRALLKVFPLVYGIRPSMIAAEVREQLAETAELAAELQVRPRGVDGGRGWLRKLKARGSAAMRAVTTLA